MMMDFLRSLTLTDPYLWDRHSGVRGLSWYMVFSAWIAVLAVCCCIFLILHMAGVL